MNKCSPENETCKYLSYLSVLYHGDSFPLPTGFDELDKHLNGGLYSGQLIAIGARSSIGKTSFAVSLACNMVERNKRIQFFSLEMSADDIISRLISGVSRVNLYSIRNAQFSQQEFFFGIIPVATYLCEKTLY